MGDFVILEGNNLETLKELDDNSVDSVVTDPPYGLSFMNKKWDYDVPSKELWAEVLRVLKPGGHLLSFGGTRTYHRLVTQIEDAGFEIRDQIQWLYGSGFPKSQDVSKAIDKQAGAKREVIGKSPNWRPAKTKGGAGFDKDVGEGSVEINLTAPATDAAKTWQGWGTALKPANEPICVARKPLEKGLTVAANVLKWGTGAINIDGSRIDTEQIEKGRAGRDAPQFSGKYNNGEIYEGKNAESGFSTGRWPANVIFDEQAAQMLDEQSGNLAGAGNKLGSPRKSTLGYNGGRPGELNFKYDNGGGASRFFYVAKASKRERNSGVELNNHPTVKPVKLMEYLIKLVTPKGGVVLDPYMGSGSTGVAALTLDHIFIGCELDKDYATIAEKRLNNAKGETQSE